MPETLTLSLPLAQSVSKPKLSHSVKFYNHYPKRKTGKKESSHDMQAWEKSKAHVKIFTIENNKQIKNFNGTCLGLAFLLRVGQWGACIPLLCFFAVLVTGPARRECGYLAKPEVHNASYRQPTPDIFYAGSSQAAYNLHYVNIALGIYFWRVFLYPETAVQLLPVLFLPLKSINTKTKAGMCCKSIGHKNHDKNKCRRDGSGEALHLCRKLRIFLHR